MRELLAVAVPLVLLCLSACRPAVAPAAPEPRTVPPDGPGVQACWVESRGRFGFTASAMLVRHPDGDVLIDAGNSTNFKAEIAEYHGATKRWLALYPGSLQPKRPLSEELAALSVDPAGLRWVLPTHAHIDHLGGVLDLPPTPVLMTRAEAELVERGTTTLLEEVVPAHARAVAPHVVVLGTEGGRYEVFEHHADLFGDGTVVVVPLAGHTPGSIGVFVRLLDGRRVFHVGDAVNARKQIERLRGRGPGLRRTDSDREQAEQVVARLHAFATQADVVLFLPAHERAAWRDVFGQPSVTCPSVRVP